MNDSRKLLDQRRLNREIVFPNFANFSIRNKQILKALLLGCLYGLFCDLFENQVQNNRDFSLMEYYAMDNKIIQFLIKNIIETGEYTLEGIAFYTRVPFDVIYDAACGIGNQFSITPWARLVNLYMQVKPDTAQELVDKLLEIRNKNHAGFIFLLTEE